MLKLALIGKNISHSKSKSIYESLIDSPFEYDLLDYENAADIPPAKSLLEKYDGINITAPYKTHFISQIRDISKLGIVNVLRKNNEKIEGTNTDVLAVEKILERYLKSDIVDIRILGSGAMAKVCKLYLEKNQVPFTQFSRRTKNLNEVFDIPLKTDFSTLVINTCARDYIFNNSGSSKYHFWDMNYSMPEHEEHFLNLDVSYIDGLEQLSLQAKYALSFWNLTKV